MKKQISARDLIHEIIDRCETCSSIRRWLRATGESADIEEELWIVYNHYRYHNDARQLPPTHLHS